jgi:uncharacterized GH25 family protein
MKRLLATAIVLACYGVLSAHEFWLRPQKYYAQVGETLTIDFLVGENFTGEFWDLSKHSVAKLELITSTGRKNLLGEVKMAKGKNLTYKLAAEGCHLFALESNAAYLELDAEKFNDYLREDGLENILDDRTKGGELGSPSRELYTRYAKLLVQSGKRQDEVYKRKVGLKHEIIPLSNPFGLKSGDYMECRVVFNDEPAAHQLVKVWNFIGNRIFLQNIYTEKDGTMKFPISNAGPWMVSTVRMEKSDNAEADYESSWASLTFGIE